MKKALRHICGMIIVGLGAFGLTFFVNEFIWEYTNLLDSALVVAMTGMICYFLGTLSE